METKRLEFRGGSAMSLIPFIFFIVITIALSFANFQDINMMVGAGVVGLLLGMIFCKNVNDYWDVVLEGLGSKVAMTAVLLWLVVGIYGQILKSGHIVEGLVWLSVKLGISGAVFTVCAFIRCGGSPMEYVRPFADGKYILCVLFLSVCCSVICYFMSSYAITYMSVARETVFANLTTAVSVFAGVVFLHEPFSWLGLVCCVLILLGIYGVQKTARKENDQSR